MKKTLNFAGIPVAITWNSGGYFPCFFPFETEERPLLSVALSGEEVRAAKALYPDDPPDAYVEYMELCSRVSDALLPYARVVFHGVAFLWHGRAWIFTAPSGTGKTTQYIRWKQRYGDEIGMMNGDKPILEFRDREIWVHPSPWMGKESMGRQVSAPLGGIVLLEQSGENRLCRLTPQAAAGELFVQFLFSRATAEDVQMVSRMEEQLLTQVPVWRFLNRGDDFSAQICHDGLEMEAQL